MTPPPRVRYTPPVGTPVGRPASPPAKLLRAASHPTTRRTTDGYARDDGVRRRPVDACPPRQWSRGPARRPSACHADDCAPVKIAEMILYIVKYCSSLLLGVLWTLRKTDYNYSNILQFSRRYVWESDHGDAMHIFFIFFILTITHIILGGCLGQQSVISHRV